MIKKPTRIKCQAGLLSPSERKKVKAGLESTFGLRDGEADRFLDGSMVFHRTVENKTVAKKYRQAFRRIGLRCVIEKNKSTRKQTLPTLAKISDKDIKDRGPNSKRGGAKNRHKDSEPSRAASVSFYSKLKSGFSGSRFLVSTKNKLIEYGSVQESYKDSETELTLKSQEKFIFKNALKYTQTCEIILRPQNRARLAARCIYLASFFYILSFIPVDLLPKIHFLNTLGVDSSYIPLFIGTAFITLSCALLIKLKGYSSLNAAIGLSGPVGLGITLLLPDKLRREQFKVLDKQNTTGYMLILAGVLWLSNPVPALSNIDAYLQESSVLEQGRNIYPSVAVDDMDRTLSREMQELQDYLNQGTQLLKEVGDNATQVTQVSDAMFLEINKLIQWLYYQRFLSNQSGKEYGGKGDNRIRLLTNTIMEQMQMTAIRLGNIHFSQKLELWFKPNAGLIAGDIQTLYSELIDMKLMFSRSAQKIDENFSLEQFQLPVFTHIDLAVNSNVLKLTFKENNPVMAGMSIVVACYSRSYESRGILRHDIVLEHIGGTLPNHLLPGQLNYYTDI